MAISISDCYCAIDFVGSMTVLTVSKSLIQRVTIDTFNVTLEGDSDNGIVISGSPATVEQLRIVIRQCWLLVEYPVFISSTNVSNSTITVLDTVLVPLTNYAAVLQNISTSRFYLNMLNVTVGSSSSRSVSLAILAYVVISLWDRESVAVINCTQGSMHAGPMLDMESVMFSGQSTISLALLGQLIFPTTVNAFVVFINGCSLQNSSSVLLHFPKVATSLRSVATYTPFQIQETSLSSGAIVIIDGADGGGAAVQWAATVAIIMLSNLLLIDSSSVIMKNVNLRNTLANRQYPATFGVIVQTSRFIGNSSLTMQNVNMTLANVSSSTFTVQQVGINLFNVTFDASQLIIQTIRCLDRVNELTPSTTDPGFAFCLLLQKVAARNSSELIVSRITSISTSAFRVLQLEDCTLSGQSSMTLLEASVITLVPSKRVVLGGATIVNKVVCLVRFNSSQDISISVLSNSTVVAKNDTQVGPAADLMLVYVINCTLAATDVRLSNVFITLPDAQCASATTSIVVPTADVLRVTNATFSHDATVVLKNVIVRNLSYCSSFAVVESCTISDVTTLHMNVTGLSPLMYSTDLLPSNVLRRVSINISGVDVLGSGRIAVTISNIYDAAACSGECILVNAVRTLSSSSLVRPLVQVVFVDSVFRLLPSPSTTSQAAPTTTGNMLVLSNCSSLQGIQTFVVIKLQNTTVELKPGIAALDVFDVSRDVSIGVVVGPNSRIVSTMWPLLTSNHNSSNATSSSILLAADSPSSINVTLDRATLIGAMKLVTTTTSTSVSSKNVFASVFCSQWGRHPYSQLSLITSTSAVDLNSIGLARSNSINPFFPFSKTNTSQLCSLVARGQQSGSLEHTTSQQLLMTTTVTGSMHPTASGALSPTVTLPIPPPVPLVAPPAPGISAASLTATAGAVLSGGGGAIGEAASLAALAMITCGGQRSFGSNTGVQRLVISVFYDLGPVASVWGNLGIAAVVFVVHFGLVTMIECRRSRAASRQEKLHRPLKAPVSTPLKPVAVLLRFPSHSNVVFLFLLPGVLFASAPCFAPTEGSTTAVATGAIGIIVSCVIVGMSVRHAAAHVWPLVDVVSTTDDFRAALPPWFLRVFGIALPAAAWVPQEIKLQGSSFFSAMASREVLHLQPLLHVHGAIFSLVAGLPFPSSACPAQFAVLMVWALVPLVPQCAYQLRVLRRPPSNVLSVASSLLAVCIVACNAVFFEGPASLGDGARSALSVFGYMLTVVSGLKIIVSISGNIIEKYVRRRTKDRLPSTSDRLKLPPKGELLESNKWEDLNDDNVHRHKLGDSPRRLHSSSYSLTCDFTLGNQNSAREQQPLPLDLLLEIARLDVFICDAVLAAQGHSFNADKTRRRKTPEEVLSLLVNRVALLRARFD
ncbi:transmembrane protein, putative [Bodo saltans]|uniref:Transmembrane protein, putative n=1 Tax=Bodo saltans TaxID=75058 RepID=A0A0S4JL01_BODSA|nr:transmembrane protein, putative [Bodo saltans]|eukprot:CUG90584.1 transmembrane protein, putative [Bodo saltans]